MKKLTLLATVLVSAFTAQAATEVATTTASSDTYWNMHRGFYAEFNAGTNIYVGVVREVSAYASGIQGNGWSAALGYNFSPMIAAEGGFMRNYADFKNDYDNPEPGHTNMAYAAARITVPVKDRFAFLVKGGFMVSSVAADSYTTGHMILPFVGIGASYALTPKLDVAVQYQGAFYGTAAAGLIGAGLTYHFS